MRPLSYGRPRALGGILVVAALGASACQSGAPAAARVNGLQISQANVTSELRAIAANAAYATAIAKGQPPQAVLGKTKGTFDLTFTGRVLSRQILLAIIHEEVVRRHIQVTPDQVKAAATSQRAQIGKDPKGNDLWNGFSPAYQQLLATRAAEVAALQNALVTIDAAAIQQYYNSNKAKVAESCVSHILVASEARAADIHQQLARGADFAALAQKYSTDTRSAPKGGALGCAPSGTSEPAFDTAVAALAPGQLSGVVHTRFGYHVIKVTARKTSLSDVRAVVIKQLQSQSSSTLSKFVQAGVAKARIYVNPRYGTFDKTSGQISPPKAPAPAT